MVNTRVAQVSNVSAAATMEQLRTLFGFLGKIEDIRLFPKEDSVLPVTVRICFVRFEDVTSVGMAQHLSNTVFLDKAISVVPFPDGVIPEESKALQMVAASAGGLVSMMGNAGAGLLPTPPQPLLGHISGAVTGVSVPASTTAPVDQTFAALGVPQPPPLINVDPTKVEEIRRTVYVGNLDSGTVTAEQLLNFFQKVGEVKYVRMAGDETQPTRFAFVEFSEPSSVAKALTYNGVMFAGRPLKINHSNNAIVKPPSKTQEAIQKELAQTMKQVRDAQALIQAAIDPEIKAAAGKNISEEVKAAAVQSLAQGIMNELDKKKKSRSPSPRHKSRSRSRRRSRSRSRERRRSRSRRSSSRSRRRSRSPRRRSSPKRRSRSRSRHHRSRSKSRERRSRSRERKRKSRSPARGYRSRRSRSRVKSPHAVVSAKSGEKKSESSRSKRRSRSSSRRRSRSKSRSSSPKRSSKHRKDKKRDRSKDRERDRKDKDSKSSSRKKKEKEQTEKEPEPSEEKKEEKGDSKIKRDYDEEEKGFDSQEAATAVTETGDNVKTEDMDMDSD